MIWHIAKKDFFDNLTSARFIVGFLLCLFIVPYTVYTGARVYQSRIGLYQNDVRNADDMFKKSQVYAQIQPITVQPPTPLSIFCKGISEQVGRISQLRNDEVPSFATGVTTMYENQFLNRFVSLDFINILTIILSLLGVFLSYDIFSREKENGTLKLMLSNKLTRASFFMGKVVGIMITFIPLLLISYMLGLLILIFSPTVQLSGNDYLRILLLFVFSLIYLSFFIFLGSFISSKMRSSSSSLIISLFIWCFLLFLLPNAMSYLGKNLVKIDNYNIVQIGMNDINTEFWDKYNDLQKKVHDEGLNSNGWNICSGYNYGPIMLCFTPRPNMQFERRMHELAAPLVLDYANKKWQLQKAYLDKLYRQQKMIKYLSCISPSEIMKYVSASLCKTSMESHVSFMEQSRNYRNAFFNYFKAKKIFSSYKYFAPENEADFPADWNEAGQKYSNWKANAKPNSTFDLSSLGYADTSDLPRFIYQEKSILNGLIDQLGLLTGLIVACIILFWLTYRSFLNFDVR